MRKIGLFFLLLFLVSCLEDKQHPYTYYYWKTKLSLKETEKKALKDADSPYLYTRFFDVDKINGKFQPIGNALKDSSFVTDKKIVPVIFITNRTFINIKKEEIRFLAKSISDLIIKNTASFGFTTENEIQIDCDWTAGTKTDYFEFLKELKKISGKEITSTLRLHQVKDKTAMGVPPVKKVYLMCYSTSSPLENSNANSILDVQTLKNYLHTLDDYPLKNIEVALPIYSWGIITNHFGKHKLINGLTTSDLDNPDFEKISDNEALIKKDGFYFGFFLNKDFKIKIEEISSEQLNEVIQFLNKKIKNYSIVYYQLDSKFVNNQNLIR